MRIAYLQGTFPSTRETFVSNEIIDLRRRGVDVEVLSWMPATGEVIHPEVRESDVPAHTWYFRWRYVARAVLTSAFWGTLIRVTVGRKRRVFGGLRNKVAAAYFVALLRRLKRQHVHTHFSKLAGHVAELAGLSASYTAHCFEPEAMGEEGRAKYSEDLARVPLVIATSRYGQKGIQGLARPEDRHKVKLVRTGIDLRAFDVAFEAEPRYDVLCVAGFSAFKGIEYLIRATAILKVGRPGIKVVSVGGPVAHRPESETRLREEQRRCGVEDSFVFMGPRDSDTVRALLRQVKVFALPSIVDDEGHMDGLPIALLEAAACGLPMVSTAVAGIPDIVIDGVTGIVVPERDPQALAEAIERLLADDGLCRRMGQAARRLVEEEFSREVSGRQMLEAFASVPGVSA